MATAPNIALEGSVFIGGAVVQWLRDGLGLLNPQPKLKRSPRAFLTTAAFTSFRHLPGSARRTGISTRAARLSGITRGTTPPHFARAALESIAYQVADILDVMQEDSGIQIQELRVDGGASANNLLMQFQADLLRVPVVRPQVTETTALGAAYLAGLAVGYWKNLDDLKAHWNIERTFSPQMPEADAGRRRARWSEALHRARDWEEHGQG